MSSTLPVLISVDALYKSNIGAVATGPRIAGQRDVDKVRGTFEQDHVHLLNEPFNDNTFINEFLDQLTLVRAQRTAL